MTTYQVNEIFDSVQGEGLRVGVPSTFIRLQGCTVGCPWCDTKYTWKAGGVRMDVSEILSNVRYPCAVITGGEPTLYDLDALIRALHAKQVFVQLETSGQNPLKGELFPDWITWSPKPNLGWVAPESLMRIVDEVKFVVDETLTYDTVLNLQQTLTDLRGDVPPFVLMPEGTPPKPGFIKKALDMLDVAAVEHKDWRFGDRLQWRLGVR